MNNLRYIQSVPILDFRRPYTERGCGGGGGDWVACLVEMKEWMQRSCLCFTPSRITPTESAHVFRGFVRFQLIFFSSKGLYDIHVTWFDWFYIERVTAHRIKITDHSCFHNLWPNCKTKLKWKHLWKQGGPRVFRRLCATCVFCV